MSHNLIFVSARTIKRHHHQEETCMAGWLPLPSTSMLVIIQPTKDSGPVPAGKFVGPHAHVTHEQRSAYKGRPLL